MATAAFKSTTRRAPVGAPSPSTDDSASSASSRADRRSRSLSRFSRPIPMEPVLPTPRRKFVNTVRGSGFPEISLDDLAIEFFSANDNSSGVDDERGSNRTSRTARRSSEISRATASSQRRSRSVSRHNNGSTATSAGGGATETSSSQRRGRSVSRRNDGTPVSSGGTNRAVPDVNSRRRRSVSVARYQISDSESDIDPSWTSASQTKLRSINNGNRHIPSFQQPTASSNRRLGRSMSQKPQSRSHDDYSSQSSALTDDESRDVHYGKNEIEKTIRAVYAQKKIDHPTGDDVNNGLYDVMRKELRSAVNEIMIELEQAIERKPSALPVHDRSHLSKSDVFQTVSAIRKNYATKTKQSEKRKQDVSAEMVLEEQRSKDGSKIVREVLPDSKSNGQRVAHSRKRSNDRNRVSNRLNEEAEKYFEDFISNIEDTDFSSFDGERSDTSSTFGGITKQRDVALPSQNASPGGFNSLPVEMEGINLPWLKWDSNDGSPVASQNTMQPPVTPKTLLWDPSQDLNLIQEPNSLSTSSRGSCNPELADAHSTNAREIKGSRSREVGIHPRPHFDMDKYLELQKSEELLFESWRERNMISAGGLLLCGNIL